MVVKKTYYPLQGFTGVTDASIAYVKILMLSREGNVMNRTSDNGVLISGGLWYQYYPSTGTIMLNPQQPINQGESINIVYETNP